MKINTHSKFLHENKEVSKGDIFDGISESFYENNISHESNIVKSKKIYDQFDKLLDDKSKMQSKKLIKNSY